MTTELILHVLRTGLVLAALAGVAHGLRRAPARHLHRLWWLGLVQLAVPVGWLAPRLLPDATRDAVALPATWTLLPPVTAVDAAPAADGPPWLLLAWVLGALVLLVRLGLGLVRAAGLLHGSRAADPRLAGAADATGIDPRHVRRCDGLALPAVAGLLAPVILVPGHLARALPAHELAAVLRHEEAHRRRRDPLRFALAHGLRALIWWHPGAWWTVRRLEATAELACDEAASPDLLSGEHLADGLARSLRLALHRPDTALPASLAGGSLPLRRRLRRLTRTRRSPSMTVIRLLTVLAVLCVGAGALLAVPAPEPTPVPEPTPAPKAEPAPRPDVEPVAAPVAPTAPEPAAVPAPEPDRPAAKVKPEAKVKPAQAPRPPREKLDVEPSVREFTPPEYPKDARAEGAEGTVVVVVHVDANGDVVEIVNTKPRGDVDQRLIDAAVTAAKTCKFEPGRKGGEAVASIAALPFRFVND